MSMAKHAERDYASPPESPQLEIDLTPLKLEPDHEPSHDEIVAAGRIAAERSFMDMIPDKAKHEMETAAETYSDKQQRVETMVDQGIPRHIAELRVLGSSAIYMDGKIVGVEQKDAKPSVAGLANSVRRRKPSPALKPGIRRSPAYDKRPDK